MYILTTFSGVIVKSVTPELIFTKNYDEALRFEKIGDAMYVGGEINTMFKSGIVKLYEVL